MKNAKGKDGFSRREFLKAGIAGTASAVIGMEGLAGAVQASRQGPFAFPAPVYRALGRTGMKITIVSFGAMLTPEPEVIRYALENGVNYIDTARRYLGGRNEGIVGKALKGLRDKVYVATKIQPASTSKESMYRDVETSLRELGTDYVDVIQLHNLTGRDRIYNPEIREALARLREQGKVRFFGVTTHTNEAEVLNALADDGEKFFSTVLVKYNFKSGKDVKDAIARVAGMGIGVIAMKTQAGGYATEALGPISPHQAALKWALQSPHVTAAIPGMRNMAELREDISVMGLRFGLLDELILREYSAAIKPYYCHLCGKCEPSCRRGVAISTVNRSLMYAEAYGSHELARSTYGEIPVEISASACADCENCTVQCINGLDVRRKMRQAATLFA
jgi:uncharacterized protein